MVLMRNFLIYLPWGRLVLTVTQPMLSLQSIPVKQFIPPTSVPLCLFFSDTLNSYNPTGVHIYLITQTNIPQPPPAHAKPWKTNPLIIPQILRLYPPCSRRSITSKLIGVVLSPGDLAEHSIKNKLFLGIAHLWDLTFF